MALTKEHTTTIGDQIQDLCGDLELLLRKADGVVGQNSAEMIDWTTVPAPDYFELTADGNVSDGSARKYSRAEISSKLSVFADVLALFQGDNAWRRSNLRKSL